MKAEELRLGNWIIVGRLKRIEQVTSINKDFAFLVNGNEMNRVEPVPLSPEILEKCGFNHRNIGGNSMLVSDSPYGRKSFTVTENTDTSEGFWVFIITDFPPDSNIGSDCVFITRNLQYLHQLQNLFFSLQGTELTIQL